MDEATLNMFGRLGISLLVGMLVGLQRQQTDEALAGLRSFALIAVSGTIAATIDQQLQSSGIFLAASVVGLAAVIVVAEWRTAQTGGNDIGMTTEVAVLLVFAVGAFLAFGSRIVGVAIGVAIAALLQFKPELHRIAHKLGSADVRAIIQFAVFSCVILPVLPNQNYGPFNVINPFNIWLMVVLITGISLVGYIVYKFFGQSAGVVISGVLGGAISSTATAVSFAKQAKHNSSLLGQAAVIIVIASTVVFVRVLIELSVVAPTHLWEMGAPIAILLGACVFAALAAWLFFRTQSSSAPDPTNPSEFKSALFFAVLYAVVLLGLAATKQYLGTDALYLVAALSGLTDMDAITLSTGRMVQTTGELDASTGWRLIVTASISNLVFKSGIVALVGGIRLFYAVFALFLIPIICGCALIVYWS